MIQLVRDETGDPSVDLRKVAKRAIEMGWKLPAAPSDEERLTRLLARAARQQTSQDPKTGRPYRVNHAYPAWRDGRQVMLWTHIDSAARGPMDASLKLRRQGMVGDGFHLFCDMEHWNRVNPSQLPLKVIFNLENDIAEMLNAPSEDDEAS